MKHFHAVAELGSISAAARHLHLAQPAISTSVKKLETELNILLFHRRDRGVVLTKAGEQFLLHVKQILKQSEDAKMAMQALEGVEQGEVEVAVPSMLGSYFLPPLLMGFKHQYPGLSVNVLDTGTRNIRQMVLDGSIELGVVADKDLVPELASGPLISEEMVVCMSSDHPLTQEQSIDYRDFLSHELVLFRKGYYHHTLIEKMSVIEQMSPKVAFTSNLLPLIKSVIRRGYAISPMWKVAIQEDDDIVTRPFKENFHIDLSLAWRKDSYLSRANQVFRDFVLSEVNKDQNV